MPMTLMSKTGAEPLRIAPDAIEEAAKLLYIRALKVLPDDIKAGFTRLDASETDGTARAILATMIENIGVAERTDNLLCQDTGIPIFNVRIGRNVELDGWALKQAIRRGTERATRDHPLRSSVVHPITRKNDQTSCGAHVPVINLDFTEDDRVMVLEMIPKGSGSENGSFLQMLIPADGMAGVKRFVIDAAMRAGGKVCPPVIMGVGVGGTSDLCMHLAKVAATRPLGSVCADPEGAALEAALSDAVNSLGIGPQGLGGDSTAFAVHVEVAATHITMNPVAVNIQCHSARRASATFTPDGVTIGF
jgi:fumarate hydratase subunit alpha/L(+)-tartrate dehydratase alpha subunit